MRIVALTNDKIEDFRVYCKKHREEIDDSFLCDDDLINFKFADENPTYIILDDQENLVAAASLIMDEYNRSGKKGRFRIFHSEVEDIQYYEILLQAILKHTKELERVFIFFPVVNKVLIQIIEELGFKIERYSYILVREEQTLQQIYLPKGYEIRPFRKGIDEQAWCDVRNAGFSKLKGSETPQTAQMVEKMVSSNDYLDGGMMILYHEQKPIGVVRGANDDYKNSPTSTSTSTSKPTMNIGPLAIIPEYQGKGLGRCLLRTALKFAKEHRYDRTMLCVNAENERAKALYLNEGFKQTEAAACYNFYLV